MAQFRTIAFERARADARYGALVRGDVRQFGAYGEVIPMIVPMTTDAGADRRQQLWDSILIGVGVSLGTTFALRVLAHFFGPVGRR